MHVCTHTRTYTCVHTHTHTHTHTTDLRCACVCPNTQSCTRAHASTPHAMFMCAHLPYTHVWAYTSARTQHAVNVQAYTHTRTYTRVCTHMHAARTGHVCECAHTRTHVHTYNVYFHACTQRTRTRISAHTCATHTDCGMHLPKRAHMNSHVHTRMSHEKVTRTHIPLITRTYIRERTHTHE